MQYKAARGVAWRGVPSRGWVVPKVNGCRGACGTQRDGIYSIYIRYINKKKLYIKRADNTQIALQFLCVMISNK